MKIIPLLFLLIAQISVGQDTLILRGELEDDVIQTVDCGVAIVSTFGKIKIETYNDPTYTKNEIIVLFICPRDFSYDSLIKGNRYEIILSVNETTSYGTLVQNTMVQEHFEQIKEFNDGAVIWAVEWRKITK